jgi:copper chaperone CopZ
MAGPATSIASMLVVGKAFGKRTLVAYLASIAVGAIGFGLIVDTFFMDTFLSAMLPHGSAECHGHGALGVFDYVCSALLAFFMIYAKFAHKGCGGHCGCGEHSCGCGEHHHEHEECHCHEGHEGHGHEHCDHPETSSGQAQEPVVRTYRVNGMSCSHCKACVEKAVRGLDDVLFAEADVSRKELLVKWHDEDDVDEAALKKAVEEAGFEFEGAV